MRKKLLLASALLLGLHYTNANAGERYVQIWKGGKVVFSKLTTKVNNLNFKYVITSVDGHKCVDLDLPSGTLWATCNIDAESPEAYGNYFSWGETTTKDNFTLAAYKYYDYDTGKFTKYLDAENVLEASDDVATANWGSHWCLPSPAQWKELQANCTWTFDSENKYYKVTSTVDESKYIILPLAGQNYAKGVQNEGILGTYYSNYATSGDSEYDILVTNIYLTEDGIEYRTEYPVYGKTMRAVVKQ